MVLIPRTGLGVKVRYEGGTITTARGSSVQLSCDAIYDFEQCRLLHVVWVHVMDQNEELTDPEGSSPR
ncbi:hypothetical protein F7725_017882 [Dissostichus mawsoni]|uniref:Uncharacterized protein n=1 Tax=Dissostichus mawsoni TaxID=36200 RepID=A0A7J5XPW9_DISMA|nr:hypothetical protein F7725_017882 [Dissostichus mawsoni]